MQEKKEIYNIKLTEIHKTVKFLKYGKNI